MAHQQVPSNAGIVLDPQSQQRIIPQSRRADGSVRKERKVKPGFTPAEDVTRFRSSRQQLQDAYASRGPPGSAPRPSIPGLDSGRPAAAGGRSIEQAFARLGVSDRSGPSTSAVDAAKAGMTKAQKKNVKRREAKQAGRLAGDVEEEEEEEEGSTKGSKASQVEVLDDWDAEEPPSSSSATQQQQQQPPASTSASDPPDDPAERARRVRALTKKLRAAEALQQRAGSEGAPALLPEQQAKVAAIEEMRKELAELQVDVGPEGSG